MKKIAMWNGLLLCAALALGACKSEGGDTAPAAAAATTEAAATEGGEAAAPAEGGEAAAAGGEAAPAAGTPAPAGDGTVTATTIHGTWNADFARALNENTEMGEEERAMAMAFMGMMQMSLTFAEGGTMTMSMNAMGQQESEEGTYTVSNVAGNAITITATKPAEEGGEPESQNMVLTFVDGTNTFRMAPEGESEEAIYFNRAQ